MSGVELIGGWGGSNKLLLLPAVPRAASALLDPSSKAAATKMENVRFIGLTSIMCCQRNEGVLGRFPPLKGDWSHELEPQLAFVVAAANSFGG
jgi:hypothetical protein